MTEFYIYLPRKKKRQSKLRNSFTLGFIVTENCQLNNLSCNQTYLNIKLASLIFVIFFSVDLFRKALGSFNKDHCIGCVPQNVISFCRKFGST